MGRISKALEKLRKKCTAAGTHPSGNSVADILDCIAEHFEAGSSLPEVTASDNGKVLKVAGGVWDKGSETKELPSVTSSDNGKVLGVEGGQWKKIAAPSGGDVLRVEFTLDVAGHTGTASHTYAQVMSALDSGKTVCGYVRHAFGDESDDWRFFGNLSVMCADVTSNNLLFGFAPIRGSDEGPFLIYTDGFGWEYCVWLFPQD